MKHLTYLAFAFFATHIIYAQVQTLDVQVNWNDDETSEFWSCDSCVTLRPHNLPALAVQKKMSESAELTYFNISIDESIPLTAEEKEWVASLENPDPTLDEMMVSRDKGIYTLRGVFSVLRKDERNQWVKVRRMRVEYETSPKTESIRKSFAPSSVLASGTWYKVAVDRDGVFKLTPQLLSDLGVGGTINSSTIKVYGNRGGMLSERVGDPFVDDLQEVPLMVNDGGDGVFNGNDYALFYAKGPHQWSYNETRERFDHAYNLYSDVNYYFVRLDGGNGKRVSSMPSPSVSANQSTSTFDDYDFIEETKVNLQRTGRQWFGDVFDFNLSYNYNFNFPNLVASEPVSIRMRAAGRTRTGGVFLSTTYRGSQILDLTFLPFNPNPTLQVFATDRTAEATFSATSSNIPLTVTLNNQVNPAATAWLDFITLQVRRRLVYTGNELTFRDVRTVGAGNVTTFTIENVPSNTVVWDVTDALNTSEISFTTSGNNLSFDAETDTLRTFVAFNGANFPVPDPVGVVENQNLHAMSPPDMIIITHPRFRAAAERLAQFRRSHNQFDVKIVTPQEIYNEYHAGVQDISAIRNFLRSVYIKSPDGNGLKYVCLMGTASYDYKDVESNNTNFVPVYQSFASLSLRSSFIADDFYTFLDDGEGVAFSVNTLNVAIGRITVRTSSQANDVVDKIIRYETHPDRFGAWRSRMLLVTDDVDDFWERDFMVDSEKIADTLKAYHPFYNIIRIYADAYQQVSTAGSQRYPDVEDEIFRRVQNGVFITNYIGHGGETGWAQEQILRLEQINNWTNIDRLTVFVTITCDFSRYDEVWRISAGEQCLLNPQGGAAALLSTTRQVGARPAQDLNILLFRQYVSEAASGNYTLGDWMKDTKNRTTSPVTVDFALLGDPVMRIAFPEYDVVTEGMQDMLLDVPTDTIRALGKTKISGRVAQRSNGVVVSDFNGEMDVSVFDKPVQRQTLVNDGVGPPFVFETQTNALYRGRVSVNAGRFDYTFIAPVNINFSFGAGKFSYYSASGGSEAAGGDNSPIIGGLDTNARADDEGPEIELYMNDESFVFGGMTNENPDLFAVLFDSSGINTVGNSIGHDIVATLDHQTENPIVLNDYYTSELNSFRRGSIRYPFFDLEEGPHHLSMRAWDVHNNPSTAQTEFVVASSAGLALKHVLNYPNPFTTRTHFQFEHNRPNQPLEVMVQIFTVSGRLVKTIQANVFSQGSRVVDDLPWDGLDDFGDRIGKGVYIYRVKVRSTLDDAHAEKMEKLVILR